MGKRTGGKRGAPFGNRNRLKHGRWSKAFASSTREIDALVLAARNAIVRATMVARTRRAWRVLRRQVRVSPRPQGMPLWRFRAAREIFYKTAATGRSTLWREVLGIPP